MPPKNFVQAGFEDCGVEPSMPVNGDRFVIDGEFGVLRGVKPDAALLGGERNNRSQRAGTNGFTSLPGRDCAQVLLKEAALRLGKPFLVDSDFHVLKLDWQLSGWVAGWGWIEVNVQRSEAAQSRIAPPAQVPIDQSWMGKATEK